MTELQVDKKSNQPKQTITRRVVASSNRNKWTKGKAELPQRAPSEPTIVLPEPQSIQVAAQPSLPPQNLGFTLLSHTEVPEYLKEKFIYTGYRVNFTMRLCLHSLFRLHNETFNIWTHVIGAVLFISLIFLTAGYVQTDGLVHPSLLNMSQVPPSTAAHYFNRAAEAYEQAKLNFANTTMMQKLYKTIHRLDILKQRLRFQLDKRFERLSLYMDELEQATANLRQSVLDAMNTIPQPLTEHGRELTVEHANKFLLSCEFARKQLLQWAKQNIRSFYTTGWTIEALLPTRQLKQHVSNMVFFGLLNEDGTVTEPSYVSRWPLFFFLGTVIICLSSSAAFHLMLCHHSRVIYRWTAKLDYTGVSLMITGNMIPFVYYMFRQMEYWRFFYIIFFIIIGIGVYILSLTPAFERSSWRNIRALVFSSFVISAFIPTVHLYMVVGLNSLEWEAFVGTMVMVVFWYALGVGFYTSRVPERFLPGYFDFFGHSHTLWHICVVLAGLLNYALAVRLYYMSPLFAAGVKQTQLS